MNAAMNRLDDRKRFLIITILYIFSSDFLIKKAVGSSCLKYIIVISVFFYALLLWINEYGEESLKVLKKRKKYTFIFLIITICSVIVSYRVFLKHTAGEPFVTYFSILQSALNSLQFFFFFSAFNWRLSYKKIFLFSSIVLGTTMMIYMTPGEVPDEQAHIKAAYRVSNKIMHINQNNYYVMRKDDADEAAHDFAKGACLSREKYNSYLSSLTAPMKNKSLVDYPLDNLVNYDELYVIPAIGISIGRILGMGTFSTILLARCFNFLFYIFLTYASFIVLPVGQTLLLMVSLLPMTLQQVISVSYDSPLLALTFLAFALTIRNFYKNIYTAKDLIDSIAVFLMIFPFKGHAYCLIGFMPLLAMMQKNVRKLIKPKSRKMLKYVLICIFVFILVSLLFFCHRAKLNGLQYTSNLIDWNGKLSKQESYSIGYLIKNPGKTIRLILNTVCNVHIYFFQMIGSSLGWLEINLPEYLIYILSVLLLLSALKRENTDSSFLNLDSNISLFIVSSLTICFIIGGLAIGWTPITSLIVLGIQGRYFLPVAPFVYIQCKKSGIVVDAKADKRLLFLNGLAVLSAIEFLVLQV